MARKKHDNDANRSGYAKTFLYSESERLRREREAGRSWRQIAD